MKITYPKEIYFFFYQAFSILSDWVLAGAKLQLLILCGKESGVRTKRGKHGSDAVNIIGQM